MLARIVSLEKQRVSKVLRRQQVTLVSFKKKTRFPGLHKTLVLKFCRGCVNDPESCKGEHLKHVVPQWENSKLPFILTAANISLVSKLCLAITPKSKLCVWAFKYQVRPSVTLFIYLLWWRPLRLGCWTVRVSVPFSRSSWSAWTVLRNSVCDVSSSTCSSLWALKQAKEKSKFLLLLLESDECCFYNVIEILGEFSSVFVTYATFTKVKSTWIGSNSQRCLSQVCTLAIRITRSISNRTPFPAPSGHSENTWRVQVEHTHFTSFPLLHHPQNNILL